MLQFTSILTLSALHATIVLLSYLVGKVPMQELFSDQSLAWVWYDTFSRWCWQVYVPKQNCLPLAHQLPCCCVKFEIIIYYQSYHEPLIPNMQVLIALHASIITCSVQTHLNFVLNHWQTHFNLKQSNVTLFWKMSNMICQWQNCRRILLWHSKI